MYYSNTPKNKKKILIISSIITFLFFALCFTNPEFKITIPNLIIVLLVGMWIFFIIPGLKCSYNEFKQTPNAEIIELGLIMGFIYFFMLPIFIVPILGLKYYFDGKKTPSKDL
jgi:hypothetical protein